MAEWRGRRRKTNVQPREQLDGMFIYLWYKVLAIYPASCGTTDRKSVSRNMRQGQTALRELLYNIWFHLFYVLP